MAMRSHDSSTTLALTYGLIFNLSGRGINLHRLKFPCYIGIFIRVEALYLGAI
ncbi:hypothetical protein [Acidiplasma sp.]|uniref:hypothetical protein n=1 Tax=Acidiplasma sp. TaxID=1872114 RepID=UPI0031689829